MGVLLKGLGAKLVLFALPLSALWDTTKGPGAHCPLNSRQAEAGVAQVGSQPGYIVRPCL
jgi:hypothetical protein